ncbi:MAG TPA: DNA polymerase I, partial [bacterium]|nr:DNA polymerase I [bacterium]
LKAIKEFQPDFVVACFDLPKPTFRHKKFEGYKATRPKTPEELSSQIPKVKEVLKSFSVDIFEKEGYEADDIIGTISKLVPKHISEVEIIILSGDLDILQLIDSYTKVYTPRRGIKDTVLYDTEKVKERYGGLRPQELLDFKALKGDPSDNIPGVPGVGEKTAIILIKGFKTLENLYNELEEGTVEAMSLKESLRKKLLDSKEIAFFSKALAQIKIDVPIDFNLEKARWGGYDKQKVIKALNNLEFYTLINRLP